MKTIIWGISPLFTNLQLFGEGGDGGAGAAPTGESAGPEGEGTGVIAPDAGEVQKKTRTRTHSARVPGVVYGIDPDAEAQNAESAVTDAAAQPGANQAEAQAESWADIKKRYKDEYGKDVRAAVNERFKNAKATEDRAARMEALLSRMGSLDYDGIVGEDGKLDLDKLEKAVDDDDKYYEQRAAERGWSTETEKYVSRLERQDAARQAEEAAKQKDLIQRQQFEQRMAQAEEARKLYPGLDFFAEMENRTFASLMANPLISVQQAYELVHRDQITGAMMQEASSRTAQAMSNSIQAGAARPRENGLGRQAPANITRLSDPRKWTKANRQDVRERVNRGEKIYL